MNAVQALTLMKSMLRSKTGMVWYDATLLAYLAMGEEEAYKLEIQVDDQRFVATGDITGTGDEVYDVPNGFRQPIIVRKKGTTQQTYGEIPYADRLNAYNTNAIIRIYYIINGTQIGIWPNPAAATVGPPATDADVIEVIHHNDYKHMTTNGVANDNVSDLSTEAAWVAIITGVIYAMRDRGDVNVESFERMKAERIRNMYKAKVAARNAGPLHLVSPHMGDNLSYGGVTI